MLKRNGFSIALIVIMLLVLAPAAFASTNDASNSQVSSAASGRDRIVAYVVTSVDSATGVQTAALTQLSALASANGIQLTVMDSEEQFAAGLAQPDVAGAVYGGEGQNDATLAALSQFVTSGGRAVFLYDGGWVDQSTGLHETFGVSLASEHYTVATGQGFQYLKGMLPPWLRSLSVGVDPNDSGIYLSAHLVIPGRVGERGMIMTDTNKKKTQLMFYSPLDGSMTWQPRPVRQATATQRELLTFFDDNNIGYRDNQKAALTMLSFLLGDTPMNSG